MKHFFSFLLILFSFHSLAQSTANLTTNRREVIIQKYEELRQSNAEYSVRVQSLRPHMGQSLIPREANLAELQLEQIGGDRKAAQELEKIQTWWIEKNRVIYMALRNVTGKSFAGLVLEISEGGCANKKTSFYYALKLQDQMPVNQNEFVVFSFLQPERFSIDRRCIDIFSVIDQPERRMTQSPLPPCPPTGVKHMCSGELVVKVGGVEGKYNGAFLDNLAHGFGELIWADGQKYAGEYFKGKESGNGTYIWPNSEKYTGMYMDGKRNGQGTLTWAGGQKFVGEWKDDKRTGHGITYDSNGVIRESGRWVDNKLVESFAIDTRRFPFNTDSTTVGARPQSDPLKAERDRLAAEADSARKRQQELEERLAQERAEKERLAAQMENQASAPQRGSPLATGRNERRVALIVGNSKYAHNPLDNPANDASDLDSALKNLGFKTTLLRNANITQMRNATRQFADDVASSDVALIFFAGHGIEAKGRNYLIPVSADIKHEYELEDQAYDAGRWLDMLENIKGTNKQRVNIVILDACRNNDLSRGWRSSSRGLARMDAPKGTFIAFATAPGKVAMDGAKGQRNSPFTKNLLRTIQTPDMPIELMFKEVRRLVLEDTKDEQVPWDNSSLVGDFVFKRSR